MKLERVMVVEDDPDIGDILELSLSGIGGFSVTLCKNAKNAIEQISQNDPQLVVLDVMLPEISGPEALIKIRALPGGADRTIVMLTAKVASNGGRDLIDLGADEVLFKPFDPAKLPRLLLAIWTKKRGEMMPK